MGSQRCSVVLRRRLGRRLRVLRERAGVPVSQAARMLEKTEGALRRIESGATRADTHLVRSMMDLYDVRDDCLLDLARRARVPVWWSGYKLPNEEFVGLEAEAGAVFAFGALRIPDLLQAGGYATALAGCQGRHGIPVRGEVAARAIRWQRLGAETNPLRVHVILDEMVLAREVGGRAAMAEQARHLVRSGERDEVSIQVIPFGAGAHAGNRGSFTVLTFPETDDPDTLCLDYVSGTSVIERPGDVRAALQCFEHLRAAALPPADSLDVLRRTWPDNNHGSGRFGALPVR